MKVCLIYLAAGNSRRFGSNKLLYELEGRPLYRHLLDRLVSLSRQHADWEVIVVTQYPQPERGILFHPCRSGSCGRCTGLCVFCGGPALFCRRERRGLFGIYGKEPGRAWLCDMRGPDRKSGLVFPKLFSGIVGIERRPGGTEGSEKASGSNPIFSHFGCRGTAGCGYITTK